MDIACSAFTGLVGYDVFDLAIYIAGNGFGILARYPVPRTSDFGHIITFSPIVIDILSIFFITFFCVLCSIITLHSMYVTMTIGLDWLAYKHYSLY